MECKIVSLALILPEAVIWPDPSNNNEPVITAWAGVPSLGILSSEPEYGNPFPVPPPLPPPKNGVEDVIWSFPVVVL